jgi:hypothetical protein
MHNYVTIAHKSIDTKMVPVYTVPVLKVTQSINQYSMFK